ncbi:ubiquinol-cytochrome c reductase iron-sulfur subunit [Mesorhizobium sp. M0317]|uniref:ubiquinol-cytochrome c reductase iron-sulfur subunit n=1 Tax=Mesorhizobium sp. M0317 TaxID=2956935 RepID=UPI0033374AFE
MVADLSERETGIADHGLPAKALGSVEVDVSSLTPGRSLVVNWNGKPVVVRNRTEKECKDSEAVNLTDLKDPLARNANLPADAPATNANRTTPGKEAWIVMVQVCTHLGCIPFEQEGDVGGWLCPCHGSQYDTPGRIRKGPAPENMAVPVFQFISDTKIRIG